MTTPLYWCSADVAHTPKSTVPEAHFSPPNRGMPRSNPECGEHPHASDELLGWMYPPSARRSSSPLSAYMAARPVSGDDHARTGEGQAPRHRGRMRTCYVKSFNDSIRPIRTFRARSVSTCIPTPVVQCAT